MLGANIDQVGWPQCGEIDVLEWSGTRPTVVGQATHGPSRFGSNPIEISTPVANLGTQFHTYAVVWEPGRVTFSINGLTTGTWTTADTGEPFEKPFFLLLNLAMGGNYVGNQIDSALTSATYEIDYVRVYQAPAAVALSPYQTYLQSRGLPTNLALNADADGDGVPEGVRFAFGASAPGLGSAPAAMVRQSNSAFTYTFDVATGTGLTVTPEISLDLASWSVPANYQLTDAAGAASGYQRRVLTVSHTASPRVFVRLRLAAAN
jgi:beta-glucanase (GH16 family)